MATDSIVVYTKPGCPQCDATKRTLARLHIPHRAVDVTADSTARDAVVELGYSALPVVALPDGRHWSGFSPDQLAELANANAA